FNLTETDWDCPVDDAFRTAGYEDATWFTDVFSDVQKLTSLTTSLQTLPVAPNSTLTACDLMGHCTTVTPPFDVLEVVNPPTLLQINETMSVETAVFPNYDPAKSYTITWHWGDGNTSPGTIIISGTATISGTYSYTSSGSYAVYAEIKDNADDSLAAFSIPFDVIVNAPPSLTVASSSVTVDEGTQANNNGTLNEEVDDTIILTASIGVVTNNNDGTWGWVFDTSDGPDESQTVTIFADDGRGASDSLTFDLIVDNVLPSATVDNNTISVDEGSLASNSGTFFDPGTDVVTMTASIGTISQESGNWAWTFTPADGPADSQTVTLGLVDSDGAGNEADFMLTVNNVAPTITNIAVPTAPVPLHAVPEISIDVTFDDPAGINDAPYTCTFDFDDDGTIDQTITSDGEPCSGSPAYAEPGEYTIRVTVTDKDGAVVADFVDGIIIYEPYVVLGLEGVYLEQYVTVNSGDVGANTAVSSGPYLAGQHEVTISKGVDFLDANSAIRGDSVMIKQGAEVYDVYANELSNSGTIMGIYSDTVTLPLTDFLPEVPTFTAGTEDIIVGRNETLTLDAGSYGRLQASQRATIILTGGVYDFAEWDLGQRVVIYFAAPSEIRIAGKLRMSQFGTIAPAPDAVGVEANDILFYVLGVNGNRGTLNTSPKAVQIGQRSDISANIFAPNGTIYVQQRSTVIGSLIGKWVVVGQRTAVTHDSGW
ncbi:MAG: hypothetical protein GY943_10760, partial [Chloroflexi bacterium]|nr:hypothetical protein [Chloroflexota bacterium]